MEASIFDSVEAQRLAIAERRLEPGRLMSATLEQIERLDPTLRSFVAITATSARREADAADRRARASESVEPLLGIPFGVKDNIDAAGWPTTAASSFLRSNVAAEDATVVARLRAAGAILVGKLNMHEFASGVTSESEDFGTVQNPFDRDRIPGGSSSGSAVAVATGQVAFSLGTDTGGSVRIPAALCGVVGLKPTTGRVPTRGVVPWSWVLDHVGPLTRTVRDAALVLSSIAGFDVGDPATLDHPVDEYLAGIDGGVEGLELAIPRSFLGDVEPAVGAIVDDAIRGLVDAGARLHEVDWPEIGASVDVHRVIVDADLAAFQRDRFAEAPERFSADLRARLVRGTARSGSEVAVARRTQLAMTRQVDLRLAEIDALVLPTVPIVAPRRAGLDGARASEMLASLVRPFSLFGTPAISLPVGDVAGLPVGLQIVTARWTEARLLRIARAVERQVSWQPRTFET